MRKHGFGDLYIEEALPVLEQRRDNAMQQFCRANAQHKAARAGTGWQQTCANDMVNWAKQVELLDKMIALRVSQELPQCA